MADPTDLGLNSPDPKNGHDHPARPHLCSTCIRIDFKALFTSHNRFITATYPERKCKGFEILDARQKKPPCCFCKFYNECRLRSKDMPSRREIASWLICRDEPVLEGFHSLNGFSIKRGGCEDRYCREHYVPDVHNALRFKGHDMLCDSNMKFFEKADNAILRVVDGPKFPGLKRAAGGGLLARRIISHQVNYNVIREWLSLCHSEHVHCNGDDADVVTIPGFQVIDCTTSKIVSAVDLLASGGEPGRFEYVTFSYVWGQAGEAGFIGPVLREDALTLPDDLPLVISDAVEVVKRLGYRYLWIDRYCIPQNDSPVKHIQIRKMDKIYSCSVLTIIAAAGDGPEYGLPGVSSRHRPEQLSVQVTEDISLVFYEKPRVSFAASKWNTRGWTYQEGLLSRRRLVFTDGMTYFQCDGMHGDEVLSLPCPSGGYDHPDQFHAFGYDINDFGCLFPRGITDWSHPYTAWNRIGEFAQRQLAFDEDTLDAISGIFERYLSFNTSKTPEDRISFFCGLPVIPFSRGPARLRENLQAWPDLKLREGVRKPKTNPLKTLWFPDIPNGAVELTCRLVNSLLWYDHWGSLEFESMVMPTNRERHLRRSGFPSWTWAGWKRCMIEFEHEYDAKRVFDRCTTVHVEYEDWGGLVRRLDWVKDNKRIHDLSRQASKIPLYLLIKGTVMDMKLAWHIKSGDSYSKLGGGCWIVTSPPFLQGRPLTAPRCLFEDIELQGGDDRASTYLTRDEEVNVLGMIMAGQAGSRRYETYDMLVMILRPVTRLLNGQLETMYERAHLHTFRSPRLDTEYPSREDKPPITGILREATVRLC